MSCATDYKSNDRKVVETVETNEEIYQWEREVQADPAFADAPGLRYLLMMMTHPKIFKKVDTKRRLHWSRVHIADVTGRTPQTITNRRSEILSTRYIGPIVCGETPPSGEPPEGGGSIETGRGSDKVPTYSLILPPNV
jgi:hypothetical protein